MWFLCYDTKSYDLYDKDSSVGKFYSVGEYDYMSVL